MLSSSVEVAWREPFFLGRDQRLQKLVFLLGVRIVALHG